MNPKWYLIATAVSFSILFTADSRNLFFYAISFIAFITALNARMRFEKVDRLWLFFIVSNVGLSVVYHIDRLDVLNLGLTCLLILGYLSFKMHLRSSNLTLSNFKLFVKNIIKAYFIILLLQQTCVFLGLPIINVRFYDATLPYKLNALSAEPSWAGRSITILMYVYVLLCETQSKVRYSLEALKSDKGLWIKYLYVIVFTMSVTSILFAFILVLRLLFRDIRSLIPLSLVIVFSSLFFAESVLLRLINFVDLIFSWDIDGLIETDGSAATRVVPMLVLITEVFQNLDGLFLGRGINWTQENLDMLIPSDLNAGIGGGWSMLIEGGVLLFIPFVSYTWRAFFVKSDKYVSSFFWLLTIFTYGLNVQMMWMSLSLMYTYKHLKGR